MGWRRWWLTMAAGAVGACVGALACDSPPAWSPLGAAPLTARVNTLNHSGMRSSNTRACFTCHHHALPVIASGWARARGLTLDPIRYDAQVAFVRDHMEHDLELFGAADAGVSTVGLSYALWAIDAAPDALPANLADMVDVLLDKQGTDGSWPQFVDRPPFEKHVQASTALAVRALRRWANEDQRAQAARAVERALEWFAATPVPDLTEPRVFQVLGLHWAGAPPERVRAAADALLATQRPEGGWAQTPTLAPDAYATGSALVALHTSGRLTATDPAYVRGLQFLEQARRPDGLWLVETRSRPLQVFFDNGDPGGRSQFISIAATGWATLAELLALPPTVPK